MKSVALFIDVDNLSIHSREKGKKIDWDIILNIINREIDGEARLSYARAYFERKEDEKGDSYCYSLFERGIESVYAPVFRFTDWKTQKTQGKSLSDPMMICDIISTIYELNHIDNFVIVTSDKDFIPIVRMLVKKNKNILVIGIRENGFYLSEECRKLNIPFIDYLAEI